MLKKILLTLWRRRANCKIEFLLIYKYFSTFSREISADRPTDLQCSDLRWVVELRRMPWLSRCDHPQLTAAAKWTNTEAQSLTFQSASLLLTRKHPITNTPESEETIQQPQKYSTFIQVYAYPARSNSYSPRSKPTTYHSTLLQKPATAWNMQQQQQQHKICHGGGALAHFAAYRLFGVSYSILDLHQSCMYVAPFFVQIIEYYPPPQRMRKSGCSEAR